MSSSSHNNTSPLTPTHQTLDRTNMKTITIYKEKPSGLYSTSEARSDDVSGAYVQFTDFVELQEKYERLQLRLKRYKNK